MSVAVSISFRKHVHTSTFALDSVFHWIPHFTVCKCTRVLLSICFLFLLSSELLFQEKSLQFSFNHSWDTKYNWLSQHHSAFTSENALHSFETGHMSFWQAFYDICKEYRAFSKRTELIVFYKCVKVFPHFNPLPVFKMVIVWHGSFYFILLWIFTHFIWNVEITCRLLCFEMKNNAGNSKFY